MGEGLINEIKKYSIYEYEYLSKEELEKILIECFKTQSNMPESKIKYIEEDE